MAQQTAVEWLYDQLVDTAFKENVTKDILEQAKQMEKEQMKSIELPSDEEIEKNFTIGISPQTSYPHMIKGAKWMRDKILNQNK